MRVGMVGHGKAAQTLERPGSGKSSVFEESAARTNINKQLFSSCFPYRCAIESAVMGIGKH